MSLICHCSTASDLCQFPATARERSSEECFGYEAAVIWGNSYMTYVVCNKWNYFVNSEN